MQIAGVQGGANKGELIENSTEAKAKIAAAYGVKAHPDHGGKSVTLDNLSIKNVVASGAGEKLRGKYENRNYQASGTAMLWLRDQASDTVTEPTVHEFEVKFHDTLDNEGMPELAVDSFELT